MTGRSLILLMALPVALPAGTFDPAQDPFPVVTELALGTIVGLSGGFYGYAYARGRWGRGVDRYNDPLWRFFSSTASIGGFAIGEIVGASLGVTLTARYLYGYRYGSFTEDYLRAFGGATVGTLLGAFAGATGYDSRSLTLLVTAFILPATGAIVGYHWNYFRDVLLGENTSTGSGSVQALKAPLVVPLFAARF